MRFLVIVAFMLVGANGFLSPPRVVHAIQKYAQPQPVKSKGMSKAPVSLRMARESETTEQIVFEEGENAPPRLAYLALWLGLLGYAFVLSPGGSVEAGAVDAALIQTMISTPFDGTAPTIFTALFNALGILPAIYASLLLPGTKNGQKVPGLPFVLSSFALGFFGVGPYLGLRNKRENVTQATRGRGSIIFEFKGTSLAMLAFGVYLLYYAIAGDYVGADTTDRLTGFIELFKTQRLAHVSTIDFTILSLAVADPMAEDMKRRGYSSLPAAAFAAVPVLGPCLYLLIRPSLPKE